MLKSKLLTLFLILILSLLLYGTVFAFTSDYGDFLKNAGETGAGYPTSQGATQAADPLAMNFINTFTGQIVATVVSLIGLIFLGLTVYAGVQWLSSGGNEEKITKAKTKLINGTIGVGLTLCAFIVANLVFNFLEPRFLQTATTTSAPSTIVPESYCDGKNLSDCLNDENCTWVVNPNGHEWENGTCYPDNYILASCGQCAEPAMFCCTAMDPDCIGYVNQCVECINGDNCPTIFNICTVAHQCDFGN